MKNVEIYNIGKLMIGGVILVLTFLYFNEYFIIPYLFIVFFYIKSSKKLISPMTFLIIPWSFMFAMYFSSFIVYSQKNDNIIPIIYMILGITLIFLGYKLGRITKFTSERVKNNDKDYNNEDIKSILLLVNLCAVMGIIGSLLFIYDMIYVIRVDMTSLSTLRVAYITSNISIYSQIGNVIAWGSLITIPAFFLLWKESKKIERILWSISIIMYSSYSVLSAGRQVVFQIMIIFLSSYIICNFLNFNEKTEEKTKIKFKNKNKRILFLVIIISIAYCIYVATSRNDGGISSSKTEVLKYYFEFKFSNWFDKLTFYFPAALVDGIIEGIVYFTHEIPQFTIFWGIKDIGPFFGLYSMPFIDRRLDSFGLTSWSMLDKMNYVRSFMASQNAMNVGWKTFFSYLIIDYGRFGAMFYCFAYGFVVAKVYNNFLENRSFISILLLIRINVGLFYTVMFPATCETGLLMFLIFALILNVFNRKKVFKYVFR